MRQDVGKENQVPKRKKERERDLIHGFPGDCGCETVIKLYKLLLYIFPTMMWFS